MARFELTVLFFICISATAFVSAITSEEVADMLDEGVQIIDDITQTEFDLTVYRAQMISQGYKLKQEMAEVSKKLRSGEATKEEAEKTLKCIKDAIAQVKLVEDTEQSLINIATSKAFPLVDKAEKSINAL